MSLYQKLGLLFRASAEAPMRQLIAANDISILEQEIVESEKAMKSAKLHLVQVKTEAKLLSASISDLKGDIAKKEEQVINVLDKDRVLAEEVASLIAEDERYLEEQEAQLRDIQKLDIQITCDIKSAIRAIKIHRYRLGVIKANQHSLHATDNLRNDETGLNSSMSELNRSLEQIKNRHLRSHLSRESEAELESSLNNQGLEERLKAAGVCSDKGVDAVITRLENRKRELST